jgi:DNA-binding transcriptional LysR family regulator
MKDLNAIRIFIKVAQLSSFTKAATSLNLPKSSVSQAVTLLEKTLSTRLLHRTTRSVNMTSDGELFYNRAVDILNDTDDLKNLFTSKNKSLTGRIRVDMPQAISRDTIMPNLHLFLKKYPALEIELSSSDRRVDVIQEGFDCVIRVGELNDSSLIARPLGSFKVLNCVSQSYIKNYGKPKTLDDLTSHYIVRYSQTLGVLDPGFEYVNANNQLQSIAMKSQLTVNSSEAYLNAALNGFGLIQTPIHGVSKYLESGELVQVLPQYAMPNLPINILYPNRRHLPKRMSIFMEWLEEQLSVFTKDEQLAKPNNDKV